MSEVIELIGGWTPSVPSIVLPGDISGVRPSATTEASKDVIPLATTEASSQPLSTTVSSATSSATQRATSSASVETKSKSRAKARAPSSKSVQDRDRLKERLEAGERPQKQGIKLQQEAMVKMMSEALLLRSFDMNIIENDFETELLNGRVNLGNIRVSFLCGHKAVRLYEQEDSQRVLEKALLQSQGFELIDIPPSRLRGRVVLTKVLREIMRFY